MRARKVKVYGWQSFRREAGPRMQTREIMAAHSWAEVSEKSGVSLSELRKFGCETGNSVEVAQALGEPGVVFWKPIDDRSDSWRRAP